MWKKKYLQNQMFEMQEIVDNKVLIGNNLICSFIFRTNKFDLTFDILMIDKGYKLKKKINFV